MKRFARKIDLPEEKIPAKTEKTSPEKPIDVDPIQADVLESQRILGNQATLQLLRGGGLSHIQRGKKGAKGGSGGKGGAAVKEKAESKQAEHIELLRETVGETTIIVELDAHQNKHQYTPIGQLAPYKGGSGSKFPAKVDLDYHTNNFAPLVMAWAKSKIDTIKGSKNGFSAGKYEIDPGRTDFEVRATYDATDDEIIVDYHCNPNDKAKAKDF
jgi:hypothetical protein